MGTNTHTHTLIETISKMSIHEFTQWETRDGSWAETIKWVFILSKASIRSLLQWNQLQFLCWEEFGSSVAIQTNDSCSCWKKKPRKHLEEILEKNPPCSFHNSVFISGKLKLNHNRSLINLVCEKKQKTVYPQFAWSHKMFNERHRGRRFES